MPVIPGVLKDGFQFSVFSFRLKKIDEWPFITPQAPGLPETAALLRGEQPQGIEGGQVPQGNHGQP